MREEQLNYARVPQQSVLQDEEQPQGPRVADARFLRRFMGVIVLMCVVSIGGQAYVATGDTGRQAALESELNAYLLRDDDNDGLLNGVELEVGTNASNADTDGDKLPDGVEVLVGMNPLDIADATYDSDGDGIINAIEVRTGTDPFTATGVMQH